MWGPLQWWCLVKFQLHVWDKLHDDVFILHALALWPVTVMTAVLGEYENNCLLSFTQQLLTLISQFCICSAPALNAHQYTCTVFCSSRNCLCFLSLNLSVFYVVVIFLPVLIRRFFCGCGLSTDPVSRTTCRCGPSTDQSHNCHTCFIMPSQAQQCKGSKASHWAWHASRALVLWSDAGDC